MMLVQLMSYRIVSSRFDSIRFDCVVWMDGCEDGVDLVKGGLSRVWRRGVNVILRGYLVLSCLEHGIR